MHQCSSKEEDFMFFCFFYDLYYFKPVLFRSSNIPQNRAGHHVAFDVSSNVCQISPFCFVCN